MSIAPMAAVDHKLERLDLLSVGANHRNVLKLLPSKETKKHRVAVGNDAGVVTCVFVKKNDVQIIYQNTPPSGQKRQVTSMALGGNEGFKDKLYVAFGETITGLKKKGNEFFRFSTMTNEDVNQMWVQDLLLWTATDFSMNTFENGANISVYMASDRINAMAVLPVAAPNVLDTVLGCEDKFLRIIHDNAIHYEAKAEAAVTSVIDYPARAANSLSPTAVAERDATTACLVYGMSNGTVAQLLCTAHDIKRGFTVPSGSKSAISCLLQADLTQNGCSDIVLGREDGTIEAYDMTTGEASKMFSTSLGESITALDSGFVVTEQPELVCSTYSGKVLCFSSKDNFNGLLKLGGGSAAGQDNKPSLVGGMKTGLMSLLSKKKDRRDDPEAKVSADLAAAASAAASAPAHTASGITELTEEISALQRTIAQQHANYAALSGSLIAVDQQIKVKHVWTLLPEEACLLLTVEVPVPIDVLLLQSNVPVILLSDQDINAMMSRTPCGFGAARADGSTYSRPFTSVSDAEKKTVLSEGLNTSSQLLVTYRCQESINRIQVKIRALEGFRGTLTALVIPKMYPKTCQKIECPIKPLCLHEKVELDALAHETETRPMNSLVLTGGFSISDMHAWVGLCLDNLPPRLTEDSVQALYKSTFVGSVLLLDYRKGHASFKSDSMITIALLKETITKEATLKKVLIDVHLELDDKTVFHFLDLLRPQLDHQFLLAKRHALIEPLQEMATHEATTDFLSKEHADILANAEAIKKEYKDSTDHLNFLSDICTALVVDKGRLKGVRLGNQVAEVQALLRDYDFERLTQFFGYLNF